MHKEWSFEMSEIKGTPYSEKLNEDEIDLANFLQILLSQKRIVSGFVIASFLIGIVTALLLPRYYEVSATVVPHEQSGNTNQKIGGLAALAGINTGNGGDVSETEIGLLILNSREFLLDFINKNNITAVMYPEAEQLPPPAKIYEDFSNLLTINEQMTSSDIEILLQWKDAELAKQWLTSLLNDLNQLMKQRALDNGGKSLVYLNKQLSQTKDADVRQTFVAMIKQETQKMMLADIRDEYLFETIDPPMVPAYPSKPNRKLIVALSVIGGFIIGILAAMIVVARKQRR